MRRTHRDITTPTGLGQGHDAVPCNASRNYCALLAVHLARGVGGIIVIGFSLPAAAGGDSDGDLIGYG